MTFSALYRGLVPALCLFLFACGDDDGPGSAAQPRIEVRLTDSPADYDKVIVDVVAVEVKIGDGDFQQLDENHAGTYDLLELTNGIDTLIANSALPAGELQEIRLILGEDNFLQMGNQLQKLETPSAQQSGLKIKMEDAVLEPGQNYLLLIDFDAGRSVVEAGNSGKYNLKPVLRATLREIEDVETGRIGGVLNPAEKQWVFAHMNGDTLGTYANEAGAFLMTDVPAGTYTVEIVPSDTADYLQKVIRNVVVADDQLTNLGTVELE